MTLPGIDGAAVLSQVREVNPVARVLIMSGHIQAELADRFDKPQPDGFLVKPFKVTELNETVRGLATTS